MGLLTSRRLNNFPNLCLGLPVDIESPSERKGEVGAKWRCCLEGLVDYPLVGLSSGPCRKGEMRLRRRHCVIVTQKDRLAGKTCLTLPSTSLFLSFEGLIEKM